MVVDGNVGVTEDDYKVAKCPLLFLERALEYPFEISRFFPWKWGPFQKDRFLPVQSFLSRELLVFSGDQTPPKN